MDRAAHRLIVRITDEYERWSYNTAVAGFMEFTNLLYKQGSTDFAIDTLLLLMAPAAPHIAAELWALRHDGEHIHELLWPEADPEMAALETVTLVVQVNGKLKDRIEVAAGSSPTKSKRSRWPRTRCKRPGGSDTEEGDQPPTEARQHRRLTAAEFRRNPYVLRILSRGVVRRPGRPARALASR